MNIQKILFPTDFSQLSSAALDYASRLAAESHARLYIVHVDEQFLKNAAMGEAGYRYAPLSDSEARTAILDQLSRVKPTLAGVACEHLCFDGAAVEELLEFAKRENVDLIVMGSHGRTGLPRLLMGSVAEGVTRRAKCPVLIVKQPLPGDDSALASTGLAAHA
jgi:universal stress protein A